MSRFMATHKKTCKVRVLVRLRPERPDYRERESGKRDGIPERCVRAIDSSTLELWNCRNSEESIRYRFNGFFDEDSTQEMLYHNSVCPLIPCVLQGHNASVFAYGPTGAGKTHTMVGSPEQPGLIPRCAAELFKLIGSQQDLISQWKYKVLFSYLEIYQEKIKDLLDPKKDDLPIRQDRQQNILIPNLTEMPIASLGEFMSTFEKASQQRKTAATKLNPYSSRSHSIVLMKVQKVQQVAPFTKFSGKFYLIDLAGSEDNRKTGNEGIRLKESGAINSSLFALGQVVDALNQGLSRIPYRNSKLTRLLQDSLGGSAHACMIANIAPEHRFYADTTNTLNFASKSRMIINEPFVRRTVDKSIAFKRPAELLPQNQPKRIKLETSSATQENQEPVRKPVLSQELAIPAGILSPLRVEQRRLQDRLAALERLTREHATLQTTTKGDITKGITTAQQMQPSHEASEYTCLPLADANRSAVLDVIRPDSPQTPPCKKQKTSLTVDENFKVRINPHLQETHNNEILRVLNSGTIKELKKLQGVGQKRAKLIADWRTVHGPFHQVQDLKLIDGFTDKMVTTFLKNNLLSRITFS
ncbi:Kinesin-like protein kif22 [Desmophyllum pertusum]|uniref:Kinesin-like protein n=1 Tax=Desmophyllum pertusum TaxID=174260 RepID=A0A9W9Z2P3_9CNID|nr:Kinesin-like protein kif22 [Desmophyllum pertusum]